MNGKLIETVFSATNIQRWNDHVRPIELTELDKQAHKMIIAYVLAKYQEKKQQINWNALIEGGLFEFFHRIVMTDIKPQTYHKLIKDNSREINKYVFNKVDAILTEPDYDLKKKLHEYFNNKNYSKEEKNILKAAHFLATNWEFKIIYNSNSFLESIDKTKASIESELLEHYNLTGVPEVLYNKNISGFVDMCGQLRFQLRWAQVPRIPRTYVLGHMLIVAILAYLCSFEVKACRRRLVNNYYTGLFHDLPEALTRDIISPIKKNIPGLIGTIKKYEKQLLKDNILKILPEDWHDELKYWIEGEFNNRIKIGNKTKLKITIEELCRKYNADKYSPVDGEIIEICDKLAAYIETSLSLKSGIRSEVLKEAHEKLYDIYSNKTAGNINFKDIFDYFHMR